jgi:hypothetical protein
VPRSHATSRGSARRSCGTALIPPRSQAAAARRSGRATVGTFANAASAAALPYQRQRRVCVRFAVDDGRSISSRWQGICPSKINLQRPSLFVARNHRDAATISPIQQFLQGGDTCRLVCSARGIGKPGQAGKFGDSWRAIRLCDLSDISGYSIEGAKLASCASRRPPCPFV